MKTRTAILASGSGTTAEAFIRSEIAADGLAEVVLVIASKAEAGILQRVSRLNDELDLAIQTLVINSTTHPASEHEIVQPGHQTAAEQVAIVQALQTAQIDLVLLLGYMKLVGPVVIETFPNQILNTHPGLLPDTQGTYGIHASEHVLAHQLSAAGHTLHIVSEIYDDGPVVASHMVPIEANDTAETLFSRIQVSEKAHIARDVDTFLKAHQK